ncbi:unnamed protein product [Moneuplotes crassus]|uniref:Uncharacterized protein n=1 Tax=Euplotes crassus TaxID=5936 RepID=A0AAD1UG12_EUPCR|nr:unnamed protein product [Moneuplotes crassus]
MFIICILASIIVACFLLYILVFHLCKYCCLKRLARKEEQVQKDLEHKYHDQHKNYGIVYGFQVDSIPLRTAQVLHCKSFSYQELDIFENSKKAGDEELKSQNMKVYNFRKTKKGSGPNHETCDSGRSFAIDQHCDQLFIDEDSDNLGVGTFTERLPDYNDFMTNESIGRYKLG